MTARTKVFCIKNYNKKKLKYFPKQQTQNKKNKKNKKLWHKIRKKNKLKKI